MSRDLDSERFQLMKEKRYLNCKKRWHILLNYLEKVKVSVMTNALDINNIKNIY